MSCFIVKSESVQRIASTVMAYAYTSQSSENRPLMPWNSLSRGHENVARMVVQHVRDLYTLNFAAVHECYKGNRLNDEQVGEIVSSELSKECIERAKPLDVFQMLKSCQCLLYQVSSASDYEQQECVKWLQQTIATLKSHIIDRLPEYKAARWE